MIQTNKSIDHRFRSSTIVTSQIRSSNLDLQKARVRYESYLASELVLTVPKSLLDFLASGHHKWPILEDGLVQRFTGNLKIADVGLNVPSK